MTTTASARSAPQASLGPKSPVGRNSSIRMNIREDADLAERLAEEEPAQALDDAEQQARDQRAAERPHAAEDDDREGDEHEGVADLRGDVEGRQEQAGGDRDAGGAEAEAHGVGVRHVDAHQFGAELLVRHRPDRLAESVVRMIRPEKATKRTRPRRRRPRSGDEGRADLDHSKA